jgi:hypothetical protein
MAQTTVAHVLIGRRIHRANQSNLKKHKRVVMETRSTEKKLDIKTRFGNHSNVERSKKRVQIKSAIDSEDKNN